MRSVNSGQKLKQLRKKRDLTQGQLAKLSGVSESVICEFERGSRKKAPKALTIFKLAKFLEVDFEYFFNDEAEEKVVQKRYYYIYEEELIAKIPCFSKMEKLIAFLKSEYDREDFWASDLVDEFIYLPAYLNVSFSFIMPDDSMAPRILKDDMICIFRTHSLNEEVPCLFMNNEEIYLRYAKKEHKKTYLFSLNKQYEKMAFDNHTEDWELIGISLSLWREIRNTRGENILLKT